MIPIRDENPATLAPTVTVSLIAANLLLFLFEVSLGERLRPFLDQFGAIPARLLASDFSGGTGLPASLTVLSSMFLHGGLLHVGGNMLYLWIFGNNVEDAVGHLRYLFFYVICGVVAAYAHALTNPASTMPMIGASGAISGILGAYLVLFPRARVLTLVPFGLFVQLIRVPALFVLGFWFVLQLLFGVLSRGAPGGGVAWFAHVGGFLTGVILIRLLVRRDFRPQDRT
ncbi:MAG TPA: rhomboid family intramembrane serine protease [Nitrospiria bacterium]|nr:rhomboid family intramembrane serine protease [Nitrospiria bacterium]